MCLLCTPSTLRSDHLFFLLVHVLLDHFFFSFRCVHFSICLCFRIFLLYMQLCFRQNFLFFAACLSFCSVSFDSLIVYTPITFFSNYPIISLHHHDGEQGDGRRQIYNSQHVQPTFSCGRSGKIYRKARLCQTSSKILCSKNVISV